MVWIVPLPGSGAGAMAVSGAVAGAAVAGAAGVWGAGAAWTAGCADAAAGTAMPPRMVPTIRAEHSRRPFENTLIAVTRPRPGYRRRISPEGVPVRICPAPSCSTDQAAKLRPQAKRRQVVESDEDHQRKQGSKARPERPFLRLRLERPAPHGFDRVEEQMASVEHGDWQ